MNNSTCATFTLFSIDLLEETINKLENVFKELNYNLLRRITGLHSNSKRPHYHIAVLLAYSQKPVKHFNRQITSKLKDYLGDLKISFYNNDDKDYNLEKPFMYPLKEETNSETNDQLWEKYSINVPRPQYETWKQTATAIYNALQYKRKQDQDLKEIREDTTQSKYNYLDKHVLLKDDEHDTPYMTQFRQQDFNIKLKLVCKSLMRYQKQQHEENNKQTFRVGAIMDLAISYLYFRKLANEDEILLYKFNL